MQINPYGQPDCKICVFSFDDFPQGRCRNIYFWRNMHPWCRGNWVVHGKSSDGPKNSLGCAWCNYYAWQPKEWLKGPTIGEHCHSKANFEPLALRYGSNRFSTTNILFWFAGYEFYALMCRAASSIDNTDFLSVTNFFAQKGGTPNIFWYLFWWFYR